MVIGSGQHQMITAGVGFDLVTLVSVGVVSDQEWMLVLKFPLVQVGQIIPQNFPTKLDKKKIYLKKKSLAKRRS
jgi:hypothetical protein